MFQDISQYSSRYHSPSMERPAKKVCLGSNFTQEPQLFILLIRVDELILTEAYFVIDYND